MKNEKIEIRTFEYPSYFVGYCCNLEIELASHIDPYVYHDAPSSVTISMSIDDLIALRNQVDQAIKESRKIHRKYKHRKLIKE